MPKQRIVDGMNNVNSLKSNGVLQNAGPYSTTDVLGYRVLNPGTGNWTVKLKYGTFITIPPAAMLVGHVYEELVDNIVVGTGGQALLYIPSGE